MFSAVSGLSALSSDVSSAVSGCVGCCMGCCVECCVACCVGCMNVSGWSAVSNTLIKTKLLAFVSPQEIYYSLS